MNNLLYWHLHFHLKNIFALKKSSTFANLLKEKPVNWFAIAQMWEKHLKNKEILIKGTAYFWDSFQFVLVQINHGKFLRKWSINSKWIIPNN